MSPVPTSAAGADRKLVSVTWPLVLIMSLMLLLSVASIVVLSGLRAYVNGEGMWSKAERQAVAELHKYAASGSQTDYRHFQEELAVPLGDRLARQELQSAHPDTTVAARGFLRGRNDPHDVPWMIRLFGLFQHNSMMASAIGFWARGDALMAQLSTIAANLHEEMTSGHPDARRVAALVAQADETHQRVAPLEDAFTVYLGNLSRAVTNLLLVLLCLCSAALVAVGAAISRRNLVRGEKLASDLRASEERIYIEQKRAHVTLGSISDAVITANRDRRVTYMNAAAERLTGWSHAEALGRTLTELLRIAPQSDEPSIIAQLERVIVGESVSGAANGVLLRTRHGLEIPVHERAAPLRDRNGESFGIVLVLRDITHERALAARLQHQATHDSLTGLTNRREFESRLAVAIEDQRATGREYSLLYFDLDQFKVINDTCGHAAGDELIRQVAWLVGAQLRASDVLARLGGDEFGALLPDCPAVDALVLAERIRCRIADLRFRWQDRIFVVNASIGVLALGEALPTVSETLSAADQACYLAKDNGRNRVQLYRPDDQEVKNRHGEMRWVERLNAALESDRFVLYAQEIRAIGAPAGSAAAPTARRFEVLLRMVGPEGELIAPMAFIPAAERYGLMPRIDRWVIDRACRELAALRAGGLTLPTCMINLSGASVSDASLVDFIGTCLSANRLPGRHLGVELTETAAIGNLASASQLMRRLRDLGCPIALDDFGSGMSSFSYLKALPLDFIKIDGSFVRDISSDAVDFAVVEAIQRIGRVMGIETVAECVENEAALTALALIGVDYAQGFHLCRPIPLAQMQGAPLPAGAANCSAASGEAHDLPQPISL
ncbi:MAG TPA: EAL domain-containing protein [Steroidobacteraceae bacterium]|nr:EAL domain-containing protein [Steroidobacteraceae bacterium]